MPTVSKKDLIDRIAHNSSRQRTVVRQLIQQFLDEIVEELGKGNRLEFRDFGVFDVKVRKARKAQNPKTLAPVQVPEKRSVRFKQGRLMREVLGGEPDGKAASGARTESDDEEAGSAIRAKRA
jgi:integration host factor subunit beta